MISITMNLLLVCSYDFIPLDFSFLWFIDLETPSTTGATPSPSKTQVNVPVSSDKEDLLASESSNIKQDVEVTVQDDDDDEDSMFDEEEFETVRIHPKIDYKSCTSYGEFIKGWRDLF